MHKRKAFIRPTLSHALDPDSTPYNYEEIARELQFDDRGLPVPQSDPSLSTDTRKRLGSALSLTKSVKNSHPVSAPFKRPVMSVASKNPTSLTSTQISLSPSLLDREDDPLKETSHVSQTVTIPKIRRISRTINNISNITNLQRYDGHLPQTDGVNPSVSTTVRDREYSEALEADKVSDKLHQQSNVNVPPSNSVGPPPQYDTKDIINLPAASAPSLQPDPRATSDQGIKLLTGLAASLKPESRAMSDQDNKLPIVSAPSLKLYPRTTAISDKQHDILPTSSPSHQAPAVLNDQTRSPGSNSNQIITPSEPQMIGEKQITMEDLDLEEIGISQQHPILPNLADMTSAVIAAGILPSWSQVLTAPRRIKVQDFCRRSSAQEIHSKLVPKSISPQSNTSYLSGLKIDIHSFYEGKEILMKLVLDDLSLNNTSGRKKTPCCCNESSLDK